MPVAIERSRAALRETVAGWKRAGEAVGVVPTMGALHEGHLTLVRAARATADRVIVTLFVNPKQFNNPDDLAAYPRTEAEDAAPAGSARRRPALRTRWRRDVPAGLRHFRVGRWRRSRP